MESHVVKVVVLWSTFQVHLRSIWWVIVRLESAFPDRHYRHYHLLGSTQRADDNVTADEADLI